MTTGQEFHLMRLELSRRDLKDFRIVTRQITDVDYRVHAVLEAAFQGRGPRPYQVLRVDSQRVTIVGYSRHSADALKDCLDLADPEVFRVFIPDSLVGKPMPKLPAGKRVRYEVRVQPTSRSANWKARDVDAYLVAQSQGTQDDRPTVYLKWFKDRIRGAQLQTAQVTSCDLTFRQKQNLILPEANLDGTLMVTDPEEFAAFVAKGIGRSKGLGFGMMRLFPAL